MDKKRITKLIITGFFIFLSTLALMSAIWYVTIYGDIGFSAIIFTLTIDNSSVEDGILLSFFLRALLPSIILSALLMSFLNIKTKKELHIKNKKKGKSYRIYPFSQRVSSIISIILIISFLTASALAVSLPQYIISLIDKTDLYDKEYVDPTTVDISFPEKKRNVIYIVLESMETSFFSKELGGGLDYNVIPELYDLASDNINFSHYSGIGGWPVVTNTTWTVASLVAQTSGVPLSVPLKRNTYGKSNSFLPGLKSLNNILRDNGYYQVVLFGSDGNYAGRDQYYYQHGVDKVYDLFSAREDGIIPENYKVWWGMEDLHLYEYARQILPELAEKDQPFYFTMLTVDTHHVGGYKCELCGNDHEEKYENVYSCASKQLYEFINWIKDQPFYDNTTIVVVGDHASMDAGYFDRSMPNDYERHIYNCFINSAANTDNVKNRVFTPMDMFPTTLAAIGCTVKGERLGLGTNLFSDIPTLAEKYTLKKLNSELGKTSDYYLTKFIQSK